MGKAKTNAYRVIGALAVVRKDKHERYLNRGAVFLAESIDEENAKHLLRVNLIEPVTLEVEDESDSGSSGDQGSGGSTPAGADDVVEVPEGEPTKEWSHKQIDAWAGRQSPVVELNANDSIAKKLEAIAASKKQS